MVYLFEKIRFFATPRMTKGFVMNINKLCCMSPTFKHYFHPSEGYLVPVQEKKAQLHR
jgi:hypothetical protein